MCGSELTTNTLQCLYFTIGYHAAALYKILNHDTIEFARNLVVKVK